MTESTLLKDRVSRASVARLAAHLAPHAPAFETDRFVRAATRGLAELELKARIERVADALARHLPAPFAEASRVIQRACPGVPDGETMFVFWPLATFVERHGTDDLDAAFAAMHELTRLASCEFAVRPFLEREPERAFAILTRWTRDPDRHVRRLVSEGTRPRLPWGARLRELAADPSPSIPLLGALRDDPEPYVRRSVANHLNDISKDHPARAVAIARRWMEAGGEHVEEVVRHGLRTRVKAGDADALALLGFGPASLAVEAFELTPERLDFGSALTVRLVLRAERAGDWLIDYAVHHQKADGSLRPKVFKWTTRTVAQGERVALEKRHPIRAITTRRYHDGPHRVEVLVNGRSVASAGFELRGAPA